MRLQTWFLSASAALLLLTAGCATVQKTAQIPNPALSSPVVNDRRESNPSKGSELPTPTSIPTVVPTAEAVSSEPLTLAFTGDIMMGGSAAYKLKTQGPDSFFRHTARLIQQADIAMGNLEGPLGTGGEKFPHKKYNFLVDPSAAKGLSYAGFKLLTLANNHTMDFGVEALQSTMAALDAQGLQHCGADMDDALARKPAWFNVKGHQVAVLAYSLTYPTEYWARSDRAGCAAASGPEMREDIQKARLQGADIVVVCCHWGQEKHTRLRSYQPELAHLAIDSGADAVVCHHPHIWQQLEVYKGKPIAYAIGNFAFGTVTTISQSGILYLTFGERGKWLGGRIIPLNVNNSKVAFESRPMAKPAALKFYLYLKGLSKKGADLKLVSGKTPEILWTAPKNAPEDAPVSTVAPIATPTPNSSLLTPNLVPTPTTDPAGNPEGSVPGATK